MQYVDVLCPKPVPFILYISNIYKYLDLSESDWRSIIRNALVGEWKQQLETCRDKPETETWIDSVKYYRRDEVHDYQWEETGVGLLTAYQ